MDFQKAFDLASSIRGSAPNRDSEAPPSLIPPPDMVETIVAVLFVQYVVGKRDGTALPPVLLVSYLQTRGSFRHLVTLTIGPTLASCSGLSLPNRTRSLASSSLTEGSR